MYISPENNAGLEAVVGKALYLDSHEGSYAEGDNYIFDHIGDPDSTKVIQKKIKVHKIIEVNGQFPFQFVVFDVTCKLKPRKQNRLDNVSSYEYCHRRYMGIRVADIIKLFHKKKQALEEYEDPDFKGDMQDIYKKAQRFDNSGSDPTLFAYAISARYRYRKNMFRLISMKHKKNHDVCYFLNGVIQFDVPVHTTDASGEVPPHCYVQNLNEIIANISQDTIQHLLNMYYFNDDIGQDDPTLVFDEPQSLLSLLKAYDVSRGQNTYHSLKNITKKGSMGKVVFDHLDSFLGQQNIVPLKDYGSIYLRQFNPETGMNHLHQIVTYKMTAIRKQNDKAFGRSHDCCSKNCFCRLCKFGGKRRGAARQFRKREVKDMQAY